MTQEEKQMLNELMEWKRQKEVQQISYPLDEASKSTIGGVTSNGVGSTAKTQVYTDSGGDTVTGPKAYVQTVILNIDGALYEFPSLI